MSDACQMCTDLMGAPGDKADLAQGKRACGAQHVHVRDDLLAALVLRLMGVDADLVVLDRDYQVLQTYCMGKAMLDKN